MVLIALWPKSLVGATTATLERTIARPRSPRALPLKISAVVVPAAARGPAAAGRRGGRGGGAVSQGVVATPIIIVGGTATLALGAGLLPGATLRRHGSALVGIAGIVAAFVMTAVLWGDRQGGVQRRSARRPLQPHAGRDLPGRGCGNHARPGACDRGRQAGEFVSLILVSTTGMMLVAACGDLISIFLGIEILSVALYVLCALEVWRGDPSEAASST